MCSDDGVLRPSPAVNICALTHVLSFPVVSSLSAFVVGSVMFFITGFTGCLCAHSIHIRGKRKTSTSIEYSDDTVQSIQDNVPMYS